MASGLRWFTAAGSLAGPYPGSTGGLRPSQPRAPPYPHPLVTFPKSPRAEAVTEAGADGRPGLHVRKCRERPFSADLGSPRPVLAAPELVRGEKGSPMALAVSPATRPAFARPCLLPAALREAEEKQPVLFKGQYPEGAILL